MISLERISTHRYGHVFPCRRHRRQNGSRRTETKRRNLVNLLASLQDSRQEHGAIVAHRTTSLERSGQANDALGRILSKTLHGRAAKADQGPGGGKVGGVQFLVGLVREQDGRRKRHSPSRFGRRRVPWKKKGPVSVNRIHMSYDVIGLQRSAVESLGLTSTDIVYTLS